MKKLTAVFLLLSLLLTGCGSSSVLPWTQAQALALDRDEAALTEALAGTDREALVKAWGEPDGSLFGMYGEVWAAEDAFLYVYFTADSIVDTVKVRPVE